MSNRWLAGVILICTAAFAIELAFLPLPGIQEDEALFVLPFFHNPVLYSWHFGPVEVPVFVMDYIGALKNWLYAPVFAVWTPGVWSIRLPVCLLSVVTLVIFARTIRAATNGYVALGAILLLSTDAPFLLTNVFDWGPVCLLLLALAIILWLMPKFAGSNSRGPLAAACFVAGLGVWYKALFLPLVASLILGWLAVYWKESRQYLRVKYLLPAAFSFALGVAPLIAFNVHSSLATIKASAYLPRVAVSEKLLMLRRTLDGRALEHYMFRSTAHERVPWTGAPLADLVEGWYRTTAFHPGSLLFGAFVISLFLLPFVKRSPGYRPLLFAWIVFSSFFGMMLLFRDAGAGPHHTVLLYPAPQFIVAATFFAVAQRWRLPKVALFVVPTIIAASNLWLLAQYYTVAQGNGFSVVWTGAQASLSREVAASHLRAAALDWGIAGSLQTAASGHPAVITEPMPSEGVLYISHCDGYVVDPARMERFRSLLAATKLMETNNRIVTDPKGNTVFCLFQLAEK